MHVVLNTAEDETIAKLQERVEVLEKEKEEHVLLISDQHEAMVCMMERAKELATAVVVQRDKKITRLKEEVHRQDEELKKKNHEVSQLEEGIHFKDSLLQFANNEIKNLCTDGNKLRNKNRLLKSSLREESARLKEVVHGQDEELKQARIKNQALERQLQYARDDNKCIHDAGDKLQDKNRQLKQSLRESQKVKAEDEARLMQSNGENDALREENDTLKEENDTLREMIKSLEASISQLRRKKRRATGHASSILEGLGK